MSKAIQGAAILGASIVAGAFTLGIGGVALEAAFNSAAWISDAIFAGLAGGVSIEAGERVEFTLFGEAPSRILLTCSDPARIHEIALRYDVECLGIGVTIKERLQIGDGNSMWINSTTADLKHTFETSLPKLLQTHNVG